MEQRIINEAMLYYAVVITGSIPYTCQPPMRLTATLLPSLNLSSLCVAGSVFAYVKSASRIHRTRIKGRIKPLTEFAQFGFNTTSLASKLAQSLHCKKKFSDIPGPCLFVAGRWAVHCQIVDASGGAFIRTEKACSSLRYTFSLAEPNVYLSVEAEGERRRFIKVLDEIQHDVILWKKRAPRGVLVKIKSFLIVCCQKGATAQSPKIRAHHREAAPAPWTVKNYRKMGVNFFAQNHIFLKNLSLVT
jgi:hypothetical protein